MYSTVFIISGPSGAGEDSIIDGLSKLMPLERVITTTTRSPRKGEFDGHPYYFISKDQFQERIQAGDFIEYAQQYNGNLYGVTKTELDRVTQSGKIGIWKMEYQGVMSVQKLFPEIPSILITVPSLDILEKRIRNRDNASEVYIQERMQYTKEWLNHSNIYTYTVINDEGHLQEAVEHTYALIQQHKASL